MTKRLLRLATVILPTVGSLSASLIPIGPVPTTGPGLGPIQTILTIQTAGGFTTETGCVAAGLAGVEITGTGACPPGFTGGNELGANSVYSVSTLGVNNAAQLQLIAIASEPVGGSNPSITWDSIALTLWNPVNGALLGSFYTAAPYVLANFNPGVGNVGFGFVLDSGQAATFNSIIQANPTAYIGAAASASNAGGAPDSIAIRVNPALVPEPATYLLFAAAVPFLLYLRRHRIRTAI